MAPKASPAQVERSRPSRWRFRAEKLRHKLVDWPSAQSYAREGAQGFFREARILLLWVLWGPCQTLDGFFPRWHDVGSQVASCDLGKGTECESTFKPRPLPHQVSVVIRGQD